MTLENAPMGRHVKRDMASGLYFFSYSTQLSTKFILLINLKMPTIVGILTFMCRINTTSESLKEIKISIFSILVFILSS